ncbi:hypothetical protein niasHT_032346 [Heterodera trifolii]|uniref:UBC core domain-containing protein n=1 Tax=Heterodera trifolii TaxID=157864 RepID=A0ABD2HZQ5_9BILA
MKKCLWIVLFIYRDESFALTTFGFLLILPQIVPIKGVQFWLTHCISIRSFVTSFSLLFAATHQCREHPTPTAVFVCATFLCCVRSLPSRDDSVLTTSAQMARTGTSRERESPRCVLMRQYEMLLQNSNDNSGFRAWFDNNNLFKWRILIDGPPETPYAGCKFTALLKFPASYPHYPPTMTFLTDILHPNVDRSGQVCISILHPPGTDPLGYEQASERWNRNRTVESILVSVQLLLAEPNFNSPANVDAAILFRNDPAQYREEVRRRVERASASTPRARSSSTPPPVAQPSEEQQQGTPPQPPGEQQQGTPQPPATPPQGQEAPQQQQQQTGEWYL